MAIFLALVLSVALQLGASILAISLIHKTRYNIAWILLSLGFSSMALQRIYDLVYIFWLPVEELKMQSLLSHWLSVLISLLLFVGTVYIKKLFNYINKMEKHAQENEQRVFSAIVKTEEHERLTFAKDLHDGLGPILSSIKMAFSAINKEDTNETNKQIFMKANFAIDEAIITLKEISNKLSPHILANFGLEHAIKSFIETTMIKQRLAVRNTSNLNNARFDFNIETVLYRVVCELITNTQRHAQASSIAIDLTKTEHSISLRYSDDGIGFDIEKLTNKGMGLSNIESRVKSINGTIRIESAQNKGMKVLISVPI